MNFNIKPSATERKNLPGKHLPGIFAAILAVPIFGGVSGVSAQDERITALEEVVVTARKREESLQDTPLAVTSLSSDILEARGLNNLADLGAGAVPTLKAQPYPNAPTTLIIGMRGTGASDAGAISTEIPVGIYLDGVYLGRSQGLATDLLDLERVEILRGPQGSLYGRNSVGGAVNFIARKPSGEFGFQQTLSWGDKWGERRSVTHLDVPAIGPVSARLSFLNAQDDGWVTNTREEPNNFNYGYQDREGVRLALRWTIGNTVFDYSYDDSDTAVTQSFYQSSAADGSNGFGLTPAGLAALNNEIADGSGASLSDIVLAIQTEGNGGEDSPLVERWLVPTDDRLTATPVGRYVRPTTVETKGHTFSFESEINEYFSIKYIGAYREVSQVTINAYGGPLTGAAGLTNAPTGGTIDQDQTTHELQFLGEALDGRLKYVTGLYYFKENINEGQGSNHVAYQSFASQGLIDGFGGRIGALFGVDTDDARQEVNDISLQLRLPPLGLLLPTIIPGAGLTGIAVLGPNGLPMPLSIPPFLSTTRENPDDPENPRVRLPSRDVQTIVDMEAESYAVFGQLTYSLQERLDLTLGIRYTDDERTGLRTRVNDNDENLSRSIDSDNVDYSITLDYDLGNMMLLEDATVYARWATGYKSGGIDRRSNAFGIYEDETLESAEIGLKTDFWEHRGRFNLAIFASEYDDKQTTYQDPNASFVTETITENAVGTIDINGVELEITLVPIAGLVLDFSYNYLDWDYPTQQTVRYENRCIPTTGLPSLINRVLPTNGVCPEDRPIQIARPTPQLIRQEDGPDLVATTPRLDSAGNAVMDAAGNPVNDPVNALFPTEFYVSQAPEHSYSLSASYTLPPFSFGSLTARLDYIYSDDFSYSPRLSVASDSERSVLNGRLTLSEIPLFSGTRGEVRVSLWGRNIADDEYIIYRIDQSNSLGTLVADTYGEPRSAGIEFVYSYR